MTAPWLSIIMPCFNGSRWLAPALDSVRDQQADGIEILFVDGSADDDCAVIAEAYGTDLDVRYFKRPDLATWQAKTNFAATEARAPHLTMLHVDDLWLPGRAKLIRQWIDGAPDAACHLSPTLTIDEDGRTIGRWSCPFKPTGDELDARTLRERLLVQNFIALPSLVIAGWAWRATGGLDELLWYTADWDLYFRLCDTGALFYHADALTAYRIHGHSLTVTGSRDSAQFADQMEKVLQRYGSSAPRDIMALARTSIAVNVHLADAASGRIASLFKALAMLARLSPPQLTRYLHWSRFAERTIPRLRLKLAGRM